MATLLDNVRREIVDVHAFFVAWFGGTAGRDQMETQFVSRMDANMTFIPPEGVSLSLEQLTGGLKQAFGSNPNFRIDIRDVVIRHMLDNHILVTYTEWQRGALNTSPAENARQSSALLTKNQPFKWLHLQETWLPEEIRAAGSFNF